MVGVVWVVNEKNLPPKQLVLARYHKKFQPSAQNVPKLLNNKVCWDTHTQIQTDTKHPPCCIIEHIPYMLAISFRKFMLDKLGTSIPPESRSLRPSEQRNEGAV